MKKKFLLFTLFLFLLIIIFCLIKENNILEKFDKKDINIRKIIGPNIYFSKKVLLIELNNNLNDIANEIIKNHKYIGYDSKFIDILKNKIIIDYEYDKISEQIVLYSYNKIINNIDDIKILNQIKEQYENSRLGPSTQSIVDYATIKSIPYIRLNDDNLLQLGYGKYQKKIEASTTSETKIISENIAKDKSLTHIMLKSIDVPSPDSLLIKNKNELEYQIKNIKYPVVLKPYNGNHGNDVFINISNDQELLDAYEKIMVNHNYVLVEEMIKGSDYRILVVNNIVVAGAKRIPANVIGNGINSINELITIENNKPSRGEGHNSSLTKIKVNKDFLKYDLNYIPKNNEIIYLSNVPNLSQGGTSEDITDIIHPSIIQHCQNISYQIDLDICGIDIVCQDISNPLESQKGAVIEVNSGPGLRMHTQPYIGKKRNVGKPIIDGLFPNNKNLPIISVTGTNGKTTTVNLIAYILKNQFTVGKTNTNGVWVNDVNIDRGDCSGPNSALKILMNPDVEIAVLEYARGGILKGLIYNNSDIGIITNIGSGDHIGEHYDNMTIDDIINIKSVIIKNISPSGYAVLNANDMHIHKLLQEVKSNLILFSIKKNKLIEDHIEKNQPVIYYDEKINNIIFKSNYQINIDCNNIPLLKQKISFLIENVMISIATCLVLKIDIKNIMSQLFKYNNNLENPGRFNILEYKDSKIILDYAHNIDSVNLLVDYIKKNNYKNKSIMYGPVGDRDDNTIKYIINILSENFDNIIIFVKDELLRGRKKKDFIDFINKIIYNQPKSILLDNENKAIDYTMKYAEKDSLIILLIDDINKSIEYLKLKYNI